MSGKRKTCPDCGLHHYGNKLACRGCTEIEKDALDPDDMAAMIAEAKALRLEEDIQAYKDRKAA